MEQRLRDKRTDLLSPTASGTETGRAIVIEPWLKREVRGDAARSQAETRTPEARLEEAAGLARAIELIEMAQKPIASGAFPGAVRIRLPRLLSSHPDPKDRIRRLRQSAAEEGPPGPDERIAIPDYFPDERKGRLSASARTRGRSPPTGWVDRGDDNFPEPR